ncbi:MAG: hypothetical protein ACTSO9_13990 [Candidatus Helarchaeota archaeon]
MSKIDIEELIKILPRLVREDGKKKDTATSTLHRFVTTKSNSIMVIEAMDKHPKMMDEQFEEIH